MSQSTTPIGEFDIVAGAKAGYERFYTVMGMQPSYDWAELTQARQNIWIQVAKATIVAAKKTKSRKDAAQSRR